MSTQPCARDGCKSTFTPRRSDQKYCCPACERCVTRLRQKAHNRQLALEREARRQGLRQEACRRGIAVRDALEIKLDAFWRKVVDPDYYSGLRYSVGSCLRGENPSGSSGVTLGRKDELGFYGGDRGRGRAR